MGVSSVLVMAGSETRGIAAELYWPRRRRTVPCGRRVRGVRMPVMEERVERETKNGFLYESVADRMLRMIDGGTFRPGGRVPSVRQLSQQLHVSVTTVTEAYRLLEDQGVIE